MSESKTISRETLLDSMKKIKANDVKGELYFLIKNEKSGTVLRRVDLDAVKQKKLTSNFFKHTKD